MTGTRETDDVEDVLSSVRRLISPEAKVTSGADLLVLTPALRVEPVTEVPLVLTRHLAEMVSAPEAEPVTRVADANTSSLTAGEAEWDPAFWSEPGTESEVSAPDAATDPVEVAPWAQMETPPAKPKAKPKARGKPKVKKADVEPWSQTDDVLETPVAAEPAPASAEELAPEALAAPALTEAAAPEALAAPEGGGETESPAAEAVPDLSAELAVAQEPELEPEPVPQVAVSPVFAGTPDEAVPAVTGMAEPEAPAFLLAEVEPEPADLAVAEPEAAAPAISEGATNAAPVADMPAAPAVAADVPASPEPVPPESAETVAMADEPATEPGPTPEAALDLVATAPVVEPGAEPDLPAIVQPAELVSQPAVEAPVLTDPDGNPVTIMDEEALNEMVRQLIRDELQGALGERITRAVRKLVRAEINRALEAHRLE